MGDYLEVSAEKNKDNRFTKEDVLSVSGEYGIVNQIEFQGRSFAGASVSNYGVVETGDVVYTKSPLKSNPYGIIKTNKGISGIVSTLYAVYKPKEITDSKFVQIYFELDSRMNSYIHPLVNKGAKNDMKVSAENAIKGMVSFPKKNEQETISLYFDSLDHLITLHQRKLKLQFFSLCLMIIYSVSVFLGVIFMSFAKEVDFEAAMIEALGRHGWEHEVLRYPTEDELIDNWAKILFENNRDIDRLNDCPLIREEMDELLEQLRELRSPLAINSFINGRTVAITRKNPADTLHYGKEVSLKIYDRHEIAAGQSRYQIAQQPIFARKSHVLPDRRVI